MPIRHIPFFPDPIRGQALLDNFKRTLRYSGSDNAERLVRRGMPLYEVQVDEIVGRMPRRRNVVPGNLVIRGMSTDKGYTKPLILYDGTEVFDTSMIDPYDIASIDVIKDGTSAIYGMRGAGGVIVVTSKAKAARDNAKKSDYAPKKGQVEINIRGEIPTKRK